MTTNPTPPNNNDELNGAADAFATREAVDSHEGWEDRLAYTKSGAVRALFSNVVAIIEHHPRYRGRLWLNEMNKAAMIDSRPVTDADYLEALEWVSSPTGYELPCSVNELARAFERVAAKRPSHPVRAFLSSLRWDRRPRIDSLCARALGNDGELERELLRKWLVSAIARAMKPGCKVDTMLVLQGKQGARKSTFFSVLGGDWFTDSLDTGSGIDKDAILTAHRYWICEMAELDGITSKQDFNHLKALLSIQVDTLRRPYGMNPLELPRGFVFCGTANSDDFLRDTTGARRKWIVEVRQSIDIELVRAERAQLWAEAVEAYRAGESWWFDDEATAQIEDAQRSFTASDSREERVRSWLLSVAGDVTMRRVLVECLGYEDRNIDRKAETAVGLILRKLGWDPRLVRCGQDRVRVYERREAPNVTTSDEGRDRGWNTNERIGNAVVTTVTTVTTNNEESVRREHTVQPAQATQRGGGFRDEVVTGSKNALSRVENAAKVVTTPTVPEVVTGADTTASGIAANDDAPSDAITVDRGEGFDPAVYIERPDGSREVLHPGNGRASR